MISQSGGGAVAPDYPKASSKTKGQDKIADRARRLAAHSATSCPDGNKCFALPPAAPHIAGLTAPAAD